MYCSGTETTLVIAIELSGIFPLNFQALDNNNSAKKDKFVISHLSSLFSNRLTCCISVILWLDKGRDFPENVQIVSVIINMIPMKR